MRGQTLSVAAAALLSALPAVYAGKAVIYNHCDFDVYSWSVDEEQNPDQATVISSGSSYEEVFRKPASGGVSIKLAPTDSRDCPITQLEYTLNYDLWYDVSNVDCTGTDCPFQKHGLYLESGPGCPTVACPPGNLTCHGAYTLWDDNWASLCCTEPSANAVLHLCRDSGDGGSGGDYKPPTSDYNNVGSYTSVAAYEDAVTTSTPVYDPQTAVVKVTNFATEYVTVTPTGGSPEETGDGYGRRRRRHAHDHMHAHHHRH